VLNVFLACLWRLVLYLQERTALHDELEFEHGWPFDRHHLYCVSISTAYLSTHIPPPSQAVDDLSLMMFCIWLA
jgi:hypothetical protein